MTANDRLFDELLRPIAVACSPVRFDLSQLPENMQQKIRQDPDTGCWLWTGGNNGAGYGKTFLNGRRVYAHRASYSLLVGPIPTPLTIDHLCRVPACVNPAHLEPVSMRENTLRSTSVSAQHARKTHCPKEHPYSGENLVITKKGRRECRRCRGERSRNRVRTVFKEPTNKCRNGHPRSESYVNPQGRTICRTCRKAATDRFRARRQA